MSGRRDGDGDAAGILLAELAKLEAERDRLNAEVEMYKRQLMAQADLTQLLEGRPAADGTGPIARVPGPRAAGHRAPKPPRERPPWLRVVPGFIPAIGVALRHSWGAHPVVTAAAGAGSAAVLTAAVAVLPGAAAAHERVPGALAPNPVASIYSAVPIREPGPGSAIAALVTRSKGDLDAKSSGTVPVPWWAGDPPVSPAPSQQAASPPSQAPPPSAVPLVLTVSETALDLTGGAPETVTLTAGGGSGWVAWKVDRGGTDLDFSATHGILQAGQSAVVTVSLDAAQDGLLSQTFTIGGRQVTVTLPPLPAVPPPAVPTDAVTDVPADVPSPAAS